MLNHITLLWRNSYQDSLVLGMGIESYGSVFDFQKHMSRQYQGMTNVNSMILWTADADRN